MYLRVVADSLRAEQCCCQAAETTISIMDTPRSISMQQGFVLSADGSNEIAFKALCHGGPAADVDATGGEIVWIEA